MKLFSVEMSLVIESDDEDRANEVAELVARAVPGTFFGSRVTSCDVEVVVPKRERGPRLVA